MEAVTSFVFLGSQIIAYSDCNHEIKRILLLGKKSYDKPRQYIKKQRHNFADKGLSIKAVVFPAVMYRVRFGPQRRLSIEELMLSNCGAGDNS